MHRRSVAFAADAYKAVLDHGFCTAVREGYTNAPRSTMEAQAIESRHWRAPGRGPGTRPDTKDRVRCPQCCARGAEEPSAPAAPPGDAAVFSTVATGRPVYMFEETINRAASTSLGKNIHATRR
jgi:hypothetical protein